MREFRNSHVYALGLDSGRMIAISTYRVLKSAPAQQQRFSPSHSVRYGGGFPTTYVYAMLDHTAFATSFDFVMDSPLRAAVWSSLFSSTKEGFVFMAHRRIVCSDDFWVQRFTLMFLIAIRYRESIK
jgi:hypothetical protein